MRGGNKVCEEEKSVERTVEDLTDDGIEDHMLYKYLTRVDVEYEGHHDVVAVKALLFKRRRALHDKLVAVNAFPLYW